MRLSDCRVRPLLSVLLLAVASMPALAKLPQSEADRLGTELTPSGANPKGNEAGTIPDWKGAALFTDEQKHYRRADVERLRKNEPDKLDMLPNADAAKPSFSITAQNYTQFADQLSEGHKEMFRRYPDYKMIVYPTVRGDFSPERIYETSKLNVTRAVLEGTDDLSGAELGFPFPIPKSGAEVMWNHKLKFRGTSVKRYNNQAVVDANGSYEITKLIEDVLFEYANLAVPAAERENNVFAYYLQRTLSPPRVAGQITLVHEIFGKGTSGRNAWIYNPGLARVNRAPEVGYDNPSIGSDGLQFNDQINMFNGSMSRYDWKLVGKKEMYIPYNSYRINSPKYKYKDIIQRGHINQDLARYELHRVWVVDATLRPGTSHQFKRRTFYFDEDSWVLTLVDCYDNRDKLWKLQEGHVFTAPFIPTSTTAPEVIYDLQSGRYFVTAMSNEDQANDFEVQYDKAYFLPKNLRTLGQ